MEHLWLIKVKKAMEKKGVTSEELAAALQMEIELLNRIMNEEIRLSFNELYAMMKYLDMDIHSGYSSEKSNRSMVETSDMEKELLLIANLVPTDRQSQFIQAVRILADAMNKEEEPTLLGL